MDFCLLLCCFDVQSDTLSYSFWTSACFPAALTSNPPRFLAPFGPQPASPQLQRPIRHGFLLLLDFCHASRSFNVQSVTLSCSFWTSTCLPQLQRPIHHGFLLFLDFHMPPTASTSNPPRFLAPFGLLPCLPQLQRPIRHAFLPLWDFCLLSRSFNVQSDTHPIHTCLPTTTSSSQRKKATPAHQCQHCFISFNSIIQSNYNSIIFQLSLKNQ